MKIRKSKACVVNILPLLILLILASDVRTANILYINPTPGMSHFKSLEVLSLALAKRGHNITVIAAFSSNNAPLVNYTEIIAPGKLIGNAKEKRINMFHTESLTFPQFMVEVMWPGGITMTESFLNNSAVRIFIAEESNKYDLVICEMFLMEALYMFAPLFNAPLILISTIGNVMRNNFELENLLQVPYTVHEYAKIESLDSVYGRLENLCWVIYELFWGRVWYLGQQEKLVDKYFKNLPKDRPKIVDVQKNVSLSLYNSHFSTDVPKAYLPNIVEIGGMHVRKGERLAKDLQNILDDAQDGVIYMSFGSVITNTDLPKDKLSVFLNTFKRLQQTILWKWEDPELAGKPENVIINPWFPQNDILAHPNIKMFISHGGRLSVQESMYHGVPIIGIPMYGDQFNNILQVEENGIGLLLRYTNITEENLEKCIKKIINESTYKTKAKEISNRFKDRPMIPLDTAVYWIEYVLRNKGASFMKSPSQRLAWYSRYMLDSFAILFAMLLFVTYFFICLVPKLLHVFYDFR